MPLVALSRLSPGHRFEHLLVVARYELRLCRRNLRLVARYDDIYLAAVGRPQVEVNHEGEICIRGATSLEHFDIVETRHAFEHMEVNVIKASLEKRSTAVIALNLRERVTT